MKGGMMLADARVQQGAHNCFARSHIQLFISAAVVLQMCPCYLWPALERSCQLFYGGAGLMHTRYRARLIDKRGRPLIEICANSEGDLHVAPFDFEPAIT